MYLLNLTVHLLQLFKKSLIFRAHVTSKNCLSILIVFNAFKCLSDVYISRDVPRQIFRLVNIIFDTHSRNRCT